MRGKGGGEEGRGKYFNREMDIYSFF